MKRVLFFLLAGLHLSLCSLAQCTDEWVKQISGLPNGNLGNNQPSMIIDGQENVIVSNGIYNAESLTASGQEFLEPDASGPNNDFFVAKYDSEGILVWLKVINGIGFTTSQYLQTDNNGNIYVSGLMTNSLTVQGVVYNRPGATQLGFFIMKLSPSGDLQWLQKSDFNGSRCYSIDWTGEDLAFAIPFTDSVEVDGQVYYADTPVNSSYQDVLFGRFSASGELLISFKIGGSGNVNLRAMICDESGYLLQGQFDHELTFDGTTLTTPAEEHYSLYQLAVSNDGTLQWANKSTNGQDLYVLPFGMGLTNGSKVVFSGVYDHSSLTIDGVTLGNTAARDVFVGELNRSDGSVNWLKKAIGTQTDYTESLFSSGENSWLGGFFYSPQIEYEEFQLLNTADGEYDGFVLSIDDEGQPRCGLGFHGNGQSAVRAVQVTEDFQLLVLLSFNDSVEFGGQTYVAQGNYDLLVIKTCLPCDTLTGLNEQLNEGLIEIYPNPTTGEVRFKLPNGVKAMDVEVYDMLGKQVMALAYQPTVDVAGLPKGNYIIAVVTEAHTYRQLLVVE